LSGPLFRLAEENWAHEISNGLANAPDNIWIVSPFVKLSTVSRLLGEMQPTKLRVVTRFNLEDMNCGVSDLEALALLVARGAEVRGIKGLHSKLYVFGEERAVVTSANFTEAAMFRNREFGFVSTEDLIVRGCAEYCDRLWATGRANLTTSELREWRALLQDARRRGLSVIASGLPDFGQAAESGQPGNGDGGEVLGIEGAAASYVKFFGSAENRAHRSLTILDEIERSGSHWACTYPKRPRQPRDGDVMFMGRMVKSPDDYAIYGEAIARAHVDDDDVASVSDIERRPWKTDWPYYIRIHHPRFLNGTLENGVSLNSLMDALGAESFESTRRNALAGRGNVEPRRALRQQAAVRLSARAYNWLRGELDRKYAVHGQIDLSDRSLDWPSQADGERQP
jgi:hypothetical protein